MVASMWLTIIIYTGQLGGFDVEYIPVSTQAACDAFAKRLVAQLKRAHKHAEYFCTDMPDIFGEFNG